MFFLKKSYIFSTFPYPFASDFDFPTQIEKEEHLYNSEGAAP